MTPETERIIERLSQQFMQPDVYYGPYWAVEANGGETHIVPADVCDPWPNPEEDIPTGRSLFELADYIDGTMDKDDGDMPCVERQIGWLARLSAPGYMDATDWTAHETEDEAYEYLAETYGDDEDDDDDLPEGKWSGPLGVPDRKD